MASVQNNLIVICGGIASPTDVSCRRCSDSVPLKIAISTHGYCARCYRSLQHSTASSLQIVYINPRLHGGRA